MSRVSFASGIALLGLVAGALLLPSTAAAAEVQKSFPFELDKWYDLDVKEDGITLHRVRVEKISSNVKSRIFRPGISDDPFVQDVQIQVEYTNDTSRDIEADLAIFWLDESGRKIDGYEGEEDMDEGERHEEMTALRSTLVYGLERAKTLEVGIRF